MEIRVDLSAFNELSKLTPAFNMAVGAAISDSLLVIRDKWQQEAQSKLQSSRADYLLGLNFDSIQYPYDNNPMTGAIVLQGKWPNMLESGFNAFDMKPGFARSQKAKMSKNGGWYMNIPMRHGTPGTYQSGSPMPQYIYNQAKTLPNWGSLSIPYGAGQSWTGYQHKNNIYDGLTRIIKGYSGGVQQSSYMTWRRVSSKSDPASWMHPGYQGAHIVDTLHDFAAETFKTNLETAINQIFGK